MAVLIVGCGKAKLSGVHPAECLYVGGLFKAASRYAKLSGRPWYILSAKYGLIPPNKVIHSYDTRLTDLNEDSLQRWKCMVKQQWDELIGDHAPVVMLVSKDYEVASDHVPQASVVYPLRGLGLGSRIRWLRQLRSWT